MRNLQTEAILLRRTNYGEADRILTLLTPHQGKLSAIAKGVRKPKSKLAGSLELLAVVQVTLSYGSHSDMGIITSARLEQFFDTLLVDYDRLQLAYECIKTINRVTETVAEPEFYYLLRGVLTFLNQLAIGQGIIELWFRLQLAQLLGRGLNTATSVSGDALQSEQTYQFSFEDMAFYPHQQGQFGANHIKLLRLAGEQEPSLLARLRGEADILQDCLWLARLLQ